MKKWLFIIIVLGLLGWLGWTVYQRIQEHGQEQKKRGGGAVAVELSPITQRTLIDSQVFTGTLEPAALLTVAPKVPGRLIALPVGLGDPVKPQQLLAKLNDEEFASALAQAEAELLVAQANAAEVKLEAGLTRDTWKLQAVQAEADLSMAQASLKEAELTLAANQRDFDRIKALRDKQIASEAELDAASDRLSNQRARLQVLRAEVVRQEAALATAKVRLSPAQEEALKARVAYAEAQVSQRQAMVKAAEIQMAHTVLVANGLQESGRWVVGERLVDEGTLLRANDPVLTLLEISNLTAVTYVTERDYSKLRVGLAVDLSTDAHPGQIFKARVERIAPQLASSSRQARVEFAVANPDGRLRPGMFVRLQVILEEHHDVPCVPAIALSRRQDRQGVFMVIPSELKARFQPVEVGLIVGEWAEIRTTGLRGQVVTLGQHLLTDGATVNLPGASPGKSATGKPLGTGSGDATPPASGKPGAPSAGGERKAPETAPAKTGDGATNPPAAERGQP